MKIQPVFHRDKDRRTSKKKAGDITSGKSLSFAASLEEKVETEYEDSVEALLNDLQESEKKMIDTQTLAELAEYKRKIKKILELVTAEGFETRTLKRRRSANRADFFIVKKINEKIQKLAFSLTSSSNKGFSLLKECEEIRGLIFDLLH